jgi:hypothetical protein
MARFEPVLPTVSYAAQDPAPNGVSQDQAGVDIPSFQEGQYLDCEIDK